MKSLSCLLLVCAALLTGCESVTERVRERFSDVPPKTLRVTADARTAYYAAQIAFKRLDFNLTQSHFGYVEAASAVHRSEAFDDARQLVAQVHLRAVESGQVEIEMRLLEEFESSSPGGTGEKALREHGFYGTYFATLQAVLSDGSAAEAAKNN